MRGKGPQRFTVWMPFEPLWTHSYPFLATLNTFLEGRTFLQRYHSCLEIFRIFGQKKKGTIKKKKAQKWSKMRNNLRVPQKIPTNPQNIGKMAKNAPTAQSENAPKRVKMAKNDQKAAKMAKNGKKNYKNRFSLQHLP